MSIIDSYVEEIVTPEPNSDLAHLAEAIESELDRVQSDSDTVVDEHTLATASDEQLEYIASLVSVTRRDGETDDELRQRTLIRGGATRSSGTTDEMMRLTALAFETTVDGGGLYFNTDLSTNAATFDVGVAESVVDDAVLTVNTVEAALEYAIPAGHRINIEIVADSLTTLDTTLDSGFT